MRASLQHFIALHWFAARLLLALLGLAAVTSLTAWLGLQFFIVPRIDEWRSTVERHATQALGVNVRIARIAAQRDGLLPKVELYGVQLIDAQGRVALTLPQIDARLSGWALLPTSLLRQDVPLRYLNIHAPQLDVRRDPQGRLFVAGLPVSGTGRAPRDTGGAADWLFSQRLVRILDGQVRWIDELRQAPALDLRAVNLTLRNGPGLAGRRHQVELDATPPTDWGQTIQLRADFDQPLVDTRVFSRSGALVRAPSLTRPGDWHTWHGTIGLDLPQADVRALRLHLDLPFELDSGAGSVQASVEWADDQLRGAAATVHLRAVHLRLAPQLDALALTRIDGRIAAHFGAEQSSIQADNLSFATDEGWSWPQGDFSLSWRTPAAARPAQGAASMVPALRLDRVTGGELKLRQLDLGALDHLVDRLPIGDALRRSLHDYAPRGQIETLSWQWEQRDGGLHRYTARGRVRNLTLAAQAAEPAASGAAAAASAPPPAAGASEPALGRPGVTGVDVLFNASERGGQADVSVRNGSLTLPGVFDDPVLPLREFDSRLKWTVQPGTSAGQPPRIEVHADRTRIVNDDLQGVLEATWATGDPARHDAMGRGAYLPGTLQLDATLDQARATAVPRYLPTTIPRETRAYLQAAIQSGELSDVRFKINGDLWDVPYKKGMADTFSIRGLVRNARLDYVPASLLSAGAPGWPLFTQLDGELVFDRQSMLIHGARARLGTLGSGSFELSGVEGRIDNLGHDATLVIDGRGKGSLADALRLVQTSPLDGWTGQALSQASGDGNINLTLGLTLRLTHIDDSAVRGSVKLGGATLRLLPEAPPLGNVRGQIDFTEHGVRLQTTGTALGGNASFAGGSQPDGSLRFSGTGSVTADGLRRYTAGLGNPTLQRLSARLSGQTAVRLNLGFAHGQTEWQLSSSLAGLGSELPAPLNKPAASALPLRVQLSPVTSATAADHPLDVLRLDLGNLLHAQYLRDIGGATARVLRGGIGVLQAPRLPGSGVDAQATLTALDADAWLAVLHPPAINRVGMDGPGSGTSGNTHGNSPYLPDTITLRTRDLRLDDRHFSGVTLGISRPSPANDVWRAQVDADQVSGQIELRPNVRPGSGSEDGTWRVQARLARLAIPASTPITPSVSALAAPRSAPTMPSLDIVIDDMDWRGMKLGRVEIEADYHGGERSGDAARVWRLSRLNVSNPDGKLSATGQWGTSAGDVLSTPALGDAPWRSAFDFKVELNNAGNTLTRLGLPQTLRNGKGQLSGHLSWAGSPLEPVMAMASMEGQMHLNLEAGQFLRADPGIAKLLGVLTLQSLPRRFLLDFRDVFQEGFAFDRVDGDVSIARGIATTRNLRTRGVQALVLMEGQADLQRETQNLHVWIVPEINAGAASLAYAAINPVVGLGTFVAQYLLRKPLAEASTRELRITGAWSDPKVERIEHTSAVPRPDDAVSVPPGGSPGAYLSAPASAPPGTPDAAASAPRPRLIPLDLPSLPRLPLPHLSLPHLPGWLPPNAAPASAASAGAAGAAVPQSGAR